jgi:hypothetical protein
LEPLEEIRAGVEDNLTTMRSISNLVYLKDENFKHAVAAFFQTVSALNGGEILKANIKVTKEPPFLNFDRLHDENEEFADALFGFLNTFFTGKDKYQALVDGVQNIVEKVQTMSTTIADDIQNANLNPLQAARAAKNFSSNLSMLKQAGVNAPRVPKIMLEGGLAFGEIIAHILQLYTEADVIGKKAHESKDHTPGKILLKYNTEPRKDIDELLKAIYGDKWENEKGKKTEHKLKRKARKSKKSAEKKDGAASAGGHHQKEHAHGEHHQHEQAGPAVNDEPRHDE